MKFYKASNGKWKMGRLSFPAGKCSESIDPVSGLITISELGTANILVMGKLPTFFQDVNGNYYADLAAYEAATSGFFVDATQLLEARVAELESQGSGSAIEIVNDLTTGGETKALSAEQGKILQDRNNQIVDDEGYFITDNNGNVVFEINKSGETSFTKLSQKTSQTLSKNKISYDLIWCSIGTSITWFYLNENNFEHGYQWYVNEKFNFKQIKNIGVSGQNALQFSTTASINNITFADLYTIEHGTNDFLLNSPIGTFSDYLNNTGGTTFYGAYRLIVNKINAINPRAVIVFTTPNKLKDVTREWDIANTVGHFLSDYANAIREIAKYNSSSIADCFNESGINKSTYTYYTMDGVHPNDNGHKAMAGLIINELNKKTILWGNRLL